MKTHENKPEVHFGLLGLKLGNIIEFNETGESFMVVSGNGTSENGGRLVKSEIFLGNMLFSITLATRRLLKDKYDPDVDVWELWSYKGSTLRTLFNDRSKLE